MKMVKKQEKYAKYPGKETGQARSGKGLRRYDRCAFLA
jgi:hypothetical protein